MGETVENLCKALAPWVARHSAAIRVTTNAGGLDAASATCVCVSDRFFLATARHNVADVSTKRQLAVTPTEGTFRPGDSISIKKLGYPIENDMDVAWIELDYSEATAAGLEGVDLEQLGPGVELAAENLYLAAGVPAATARFHSDRGSATVNLKFLCLMTEPFEIRSESDLKLSYSGKAVRSDGSVRELDPPNGMSGGGLWSVTHEQWYDVWVPHRCRMLGIVSTYCKKMGYLSCVGIKDWIALLCESEPSVKEAVRELARTA